MLKRSVYGVIAALVVVSLGVAFFVYRGSGVVDSPDSDTASETCNENIDPVCGADGITYDSSCDADQAGVTIAHEGACVVQTNLTDYERQYLLWLLRQRQEAGLANVPIRHERTQLQRCQDCYNLYYAWTQDGTAVTIRIGVEYGQIVDARDSTGYDYLSASEATGESLESSAERE